MATPGGTAIPQTTPGGTVVPLYPPMSTVPVGPDGQPIGSLPPQPPMMEVAPFPISDQELVKYDGPGRLVAVVVKPLFHGTLEELEKLQAEEAAAAEAFAQEQEVMMAQVQAAEAAMHGIPFQVQASPQPVQA